MLSSIPLHNHCTQLSHFVFPAYKIQNKIILGDFNVYSTFPWPVQLLLDPSDNKAKKKCLAQRMSAPNQHSYSKNGQYIDVWKKIYPDNPGLTFSNMVICGYIFNKFYFQ